MPNLEKIFTDAIAQDMGINPSDVTVMFIHEQRERHIYPETRYECEPGLASFTGKEWGTIEKFADALLMVALA